jgi:hypothetical protein
MKPGQAIHIQLTDAEARPLPIDNVLVQIEFFKNGNYRYGFEAGRTDDRGQLIVSYDDVENQRRKRSVENLMDYNTRLEDCDPVAKITILSDRELRSREQKVLKNYGREPDWAQAWPSNARVEADQKTIELSGQAINVELLTRRV